MKAVRTRFAPSPTGMLHIGAARTALYAFLLARKHGGQFLLRIEDTDQQRLVPGAIRQIIESLSWLGITIDEGPSCQDLKDVGEYWEGAPDLGGAKGPYIQSLRKKRYQEIAELLVTKGVAYRCDCTPEMIERERLEQMARKELPGYSGYCRDRNISPDKPHVIRFKMPTGRNNVVLHDAVRGRVTWENLSLRDTVILKSDGFPTYHLAVVIDDHDMEISHVIRAEEWLATTPIHLLIHEALDWEAPIFAHVSQVLGPDGKKLSKRHGATAIEGFRDQGYLPEALRNFVALVGWSPGDGEEQEVFSLEELGQRFSLEGLSPSGGVFDPTKLQWMNGVYLRNLSVETFMERCRPFFPEGAFEKCSDRLVLIADLVKERIKLLPEVPEMVEFLFSDTMVPEYPACLKQGVTASIAADLIEAVLPELRSMEDFASAKIEGVLRPLVERFGLKVGAVFGVFRISVLGKSVTPPLFESISALGQKSTIRRLESAVSHYRGMP